MDSPKFESFQRVRVRDAAEIPDPGRIRRMTTSWE